MNKSMIAYILGWIMKLEGLFMLIPVLVALIYREHNGMWFAIVAVCALVFGAVVTHKKPESNVFYMREGCTVRIIFTEMTRTAFPFICMQTEKSDVRDYRRGIRYQRKKP